MSLWAILLIGLFANPGETDTSKQELQAAPYDPARISGFLIDSRIAESSGLAASNEHPGRFWTHNDGGNEPILFAINAGGNRLGFVRIEPAKNTDWEDLTSFVRDGQSYIGIADVGDNGGLRKSLRIYIIKEPRDPQGQAITPDQVFEFDLENGPKDIESVAYDASEDAFYLLTKRGFPAYLHRLPWPIDNRQGLHTAVRVGTVAGIPQPDAKDQETDPRGWLYRAQPTAMDITSDGRLAVVLTYRHAYLFPRQQAETWGTAMARNPQVIKLPPLPQGEGIAFDQQGQILISTEKWPAALLLIKPSQ